MASSFIEKPAGYLEGKLLIATPFMTGNCFVRSLIYVFAHDSDGAMGIVLNHVFDNLKYSQIFNQLNIDAQPNGAEDLPVHFGGPVESERGFVLHTREGLDSGYLTSHEGTVLTKHENIILSSNIDILKEIAKGTGPKHSIFALGYAGWEAGQLEQEIALNSWIPVNATPEVIFNNTHASRWMETAEAFGIDMRRLSSQVGHA